MLRVTLFKAFELPAFCIFALSVKLMLSPRR